jgi:phosphate-selective porin OprO/OprP
MKTNTLVRNNASPVAARPSRVAASASKRFWSRLSARWHSPLLSGRVFFPPGASPVLHYWLQSFRAMLAVAAFSGCLLPLRGADNTDAEIQALREQIRLLDQRLTQLQQQQQQLKDQQAAAAAKAVADQAAAVATAPKIAITDKGFTLASGDGANSIRIGGLVQLDSRLFFNDGGGVLNNTFVLRRARPIVEGAFDKIYSFQFVSEFGGTSTPSILDANLGIALNDALQFKFGKFKTPVGLEWLQSDSWTFFDERSLVTDLMPNRDLGIQVGGRFAGGVVTYAAGVFNGVPDSTNSSNADFDNDKDVFGRLYVQPFKTSQTSLLQGLAFGVGASVGREKGASAVTSGYKTDGQQTFFKYRSTVVGDGQVWRVSPQAEYRHGPFGAIGEYVVSTVNARPAAAKPKTELENKAWQLAAGYVLTGENSSYTGVVPGHPFSWENGTWGAWEVVARYADLKIDGKAFPLLADPAVNADGATSVGLGLNWYLSRTVRTTFDFYQTRFDNLVPVSSTQVLRQDERAFITRFQISF